MVLMKRVLCLFVFRLCFGSRQIRKSKEICKKSKDSSIVVQNPAQFTKTKQVMLLVFPNMCLCLLVISIYSRFQTLRTSSVHLHQSGLLIFQFFFFFFLYLIYNNQCGTAAEAQSDQQNPNLLLPTCCAYVCVCVRDRKRKTSFLIYDDSCD